MLHPDFTPPNISVTPTGITTRGIHKCEVLLADCAWSRDGIYPGRVPSYGCSTETIVDRYANSPSLAQWSFSKLTVTCVLSAHATKRHSKPRRLTFELAKSHRR